MVKVFTTLKHRFGKSLTIGSTPVQIDGSGYAEISEELISTALISGFELVDKSIKFQTEEEKAHIEEVQDILSSAKKQAEEIVAEAEKKAANIIAEAQKKAGVIIAENQVSEKDAKKEELNSKTVNELKAIAATAGIEESKYKYLKKDELVNLLISYIFTEN